MRNIQGLFIHKLVDRLAIVNALVAPLVVSLIREDFFADTGGVAGAPGLGCSKALPFGCYHDINSMRRRCGSDFGATA